MAFHKHFRAFGQAPGEPGEPGGPDDSYTGNGYEPGPWSPGIDESYGGNGYEPGPWSPGVDTYTDTSLDWTSFFDFAPYEVGPWSPGVDVPGEWGETFTVSPEDIISLETGLTEPGLFDIQMASYTPQLSFTVAEEEAAVNQLLKDGYYLEPGDALYGRAVEMWAKQDINLTTSSLNAVLNGLLKYGVPVLRAALGLTPLGMIAKTGIGLALTIGPQLLTPKQAVNKVASDKIASSTGIPTTTIEKNITQNMDIIGAKKDYADASDRNDTVGMQSAVSRATSAIKAGGSISPNTPLDRSMLDAYDMWSQSQTQPQLASFMSGEIFGIPTWIILTGLGLGVVFGGRSKIVNKRKKRYGKRT